MIALLIPLVACQVSWPAPTPDEIAKAVDQLGSASFRQREKASAFLWKAGKVAEPALLKALKSEDKEVVGRARAILDKFKYGIYPDTPKPVLDLITKFRGGTDEVKRQVIQDLNKLGSPGHAVLVKLAGIEEDQHRRRMLFDLLSEDVVPGLLAAGRYDEVEELLELGVSKGDEQSIRSYSVFLLLRGTLDARISQWAAKAKKLTGFQAAEVLMYLYRVKGDLAKARSAARKTDKKHLLAAIITEQGDWKELAANYGAPSENEDRLEELAYKAAYQRLAGDTQAFEKSIAAIREYGAANIGYVKRAAQALLLNFRPKEAIELLKKSHELTFVFELLCAQQRYKEAFEIAGKAQGNVGPREMFSLGIAEARTHFVLGDRDKAVKMLARLADENEDPKFQRGNSFANFLKVIETEQQLDLKDEAFAHCAKIALQAARQEQLAKLFGQVFPEEGSRAEVWWLHFRKQHDKEEPAATLKRVRAVLERKLTDKEFADVVQELERAAAGLTKPEERADRLQALAETCLAYGKKGLAESYFQKAGSATALARLADLLADKKQWLPAAEKYGEAWAKDRSQAATLYLRGWALKQAGQTQEATRVMALAHMIPLANDKARAQLALTLSQHDLTEAADAERQFLLRSGRFNYAEISNAQRLQGIAAYSRKQFARAADLYERTMHVCFGYVYFVRPTAYLSIPAVVQHMRARAFLAEGKTDLAIKEMEACLVGVPGDLEGVIHLFPDLEKLGKKKEAEELFNSVFAHYEKVCGDYPKSGQNHNTIAWLAVSCRRQLDKALEHARKAVALSPRNAAYLDTLAEVHYQRGDKAEAVKLMKKCVELDPKHDYYHKQIKRFGASGPPSPTPQ
jgi:tetratricopeptide (TPR) repeat protein